MQGSVNIELLEILLIWCNCLCDAVQAQLHQMRNDTNLVESPWVGSREQLPQPQYSWEAPNLGL
jgi:hypothetical protein